MTSRNVEIKACIKDHAFVKSTAETLSGGKGSVLLQRDVFFTVPNGRLKLRYVKDSHCELIAYNRSENRGPKVCEYQTTYITNGEELESVLQCAFMQKKVVEKTRLLYIVGQTRVHVDDVAGLGHFMELEVVLGEKQSVDEGTRIAKDLMNKFRIVDEDTIDVPYVDMLP